MLSSVASSFRPDPLARPWMSHDPRAKLDGRNSVDRSPARLQSSPRPFTSDALSNWKGCEMRELSPSITRRGAVLGTCAAVLAQTGQLWGADPVRIGQIAPLSGGGAASGPSHVNGARLALDMVNAAGGVLSRSVELVVEDGLSTPEGAVAAFGRLTGRGDVVAVIGSTRSVEMHALAPEALKIGQPLLFGGTDPALTQLDNPWLFRCQPNDLYSARAMAVFGVGELSRRNWAILHSSDPFGTSGAAALRAALQELDARVALARD